VRVLPVVLVAAACAACGSSSSDVNSAEANSGSGSAAAPADASVAVVADAAPPAPPKAGHDFIADIRVLYRVAACGAQDEPLPEALTHGDADRTAKLQKIVDAHCKALAPVMAKFKDDYFRDARAWFVAHEPKDLPRAAIYPFGGGDVEAALVAFPDATDITTLSLELAGDPRKIESLSPQELDQNLAAFRKDAAPMIGADTNLSVNLSDQQRNAIAAQLSTHLLGMAAGGYEPVSARFFTLDDAGAVHYLEQTDIDADTKPGKSLRDNWKAPKFAQSFGNVEIEFRKVGDPKDVRVFRHIAWDLGDAGLKKKPGALAFLESKGKVAVCVKGAVYLLWQNDFSTLRDYLLKNLVWMVSDSTGIPPNYAEPGGMVQEAYGKFEAPLLKQAFGTKSDKAMRKLFETPTDTIAFQFGYLDHYNHKHLVITKPKT
jgi:hypothetical protein